MARTAESYSLEELDRHDRILTELRIANRRLEAIEQHEPRTESGTRLMLFSIFLLVLAIYVAVQGWERLEEPAEE